MKVRAEIVGNTIAVTSQWPNKIGKARARNIPGVKAVWDKTVEPNRFLYWGYPLNMRSAVALRKEFGDDLILGPSLTLWGWSERRKHEDLERLRAGGDADLPLVREREPELWEALQNRPFQITGAAFIAKAKSVCLGDEMRLGKTYQAIAAMVECDCHRVLVACPKTAIVSVWVRKIQELAPGYQVWYCPDGRDERNAIIDEFNTDTYSRKVLVVNHEMVREIRRWSCEHPRKVSEDVKFFNFRGSNTKWCASHKKWEGKVQPGRHRGCSGNHDHTSRYHAEFPGLFKLPWDGIILDECHKLLASESNIQSVHITQGRTGAVHLPIAAGGMKLALSGTPFRSKLTKSWGVLNWLDPKGFSSFWKYADELFYVSGPDTGPKNIGRLRSEEVLQDVLRPRYLARSKADVAPWLPAVQRVPIYLPMLGGQADAYYSILDDAYVELEGGRLNANGILAELTRLRQFACAYGRLGPDRQFMPALPSNKLEWILQFLEEMWDIPERKAVIASGFTKIANLFAGAIMAARYPVITLTGETSSRQREVAQDTFLGDPSCRIIVINLYAGGEAIDLSSADDLILVDEPWTDAPRQQVENRIQDLAKMQQVTVHYLRSENAIDQQMAEMNDEQRRALLAAKPEATKEFLRREL